MAPLTKKQKETLKAHSVHHTKRHMEYMRNSMKRGATFTQAHKRAQKAVGTYWHRLVGCGVAKDIMAH